MSKVILEFTKSHGPYVKGDVAGFHPDKAAKLQKVTKPFDAKKATSVDLKLSVDSEAMRTEIKAAEGKLKAEADKLDARAQALDAREKELADLEKAAQVAADGAGGPDPSTKAKKTGKGEPPAQGQATAKANK